VITAPFSGRVGLRHVSLGGLVNPGAVITTLDDLSIVKLDFAVPELFLASLRSGLTIAAQSSAYPGSTFQGRVASVDTRVDPTTRAVAVRALIDNRDGRLRPGMFMTLRLVRAESQALMLPEEAIVPEEDHHFVFVVDDGKAHKRPVSVGRRRPGEVEILDGLTARDTVIVDGTLNVSEGTPVSVRLAGSAPTSS
jgi:membrane fusion protein (multidrug efflux system)